MKIKLTGDKILAIRERKKETTDGGIFIPEANREDLFYKGTDRAKVVAAGKGFRNKKTNKVIPIQVKKGDTILFNGAKCIDVTIAGKSYVMVREAEVYGVDESSPDARS